MTPRRYNGEISALALQNDRVVRLPVGIPVTRGGLPEAEGNRPGSKVQPLTCKAHAATSACISDRLLLGASPGLNPLLISHIA